MLVKTFHVLIIVFLSWCLTSFAQEIYPRDHEVMLTGEIYIPPASLTSSPFLTPDWVKGAISTRSGQNFAQQLMKYNRLLDELFWLSPEKYQHIMLDKQKIRCFSFFSGGDTLWFEIIYIPDVITGKQKPVYAQRIYEGSVLIYAIRSARFSSRTETVNVGGRPVRQQILQKRDHYFLFHPGKDHYSPLRPDKRSVIRFFPEKEKEIKVFIRKNKMKIKNENQLVETFRILDDQGFLDGK